MNADTLPASTLPESHRWSLWCREPPYWDFWEFLAFNRPGRLAAIEAEIARGSPRLETLILAPGERPVYVDFFEG